MTCKQWCSGKQSKQNVKLGLASDPGPSKQEQSRQVETVGKQQYKDKQQPYAGASACGRETWLGGVECWRIKWFFRSNMVADTFQGATKSMPCPLEAGEQYLVVCMDDGPGSHRWVLGR